MRRSELGEGGEARLVTVSKSSFSHFLISRDYIELRSLMSSTKSMLAWQSLIVLIIYPLSFVADLL
jgi:hypothetical protein